jgi:uncharacterized protein DUF3313
MDRFIDSSHAIEVAFVLLFLGHTLAGLPPQTLSSAIQDAQSSRVASVYQRPGMAWGKYKTILLKPLVVTPNVRSPPQKGVLAEFGVNYLLSERDVSALQSYFEASMRATFGRSGFTFVTEAQPDTLVVAARVGDIALNPPVRNSPKDYPAFGFSASSASGSLTISAILADGAKKTVLAEVPKRKFGANISREAGSQAGVAAVKAAFDQWARDLRDWLRSN